MCMFTFHYPVEVEVFCFVVRMENSVLGNALEGVPEESEEEEQPNDPNIESANNLDGQYKMIPHMISPVSSKSTFYRV